MPDDQPSPVPDQPTPRPRGRIGLWSDRVRALLLLALLAVAGGVLGLANPGGEAERVRDGLTAGGSGQRASLPDLPTALLSVADADRRHDDGASGGDDPPRPAALSAIPPAFQGPRPALATWSPASAIIPTARAGHAAHMPTGPPAGLSA